ncbi:hypothetical protein [Nocardia mangyaensis]|uniref:hypothetical protein n=1 Tax=Nocardia mangyaensis TaxID=2213200 RepID=UPI001F0A2572|nr:hypothetical protein [Nocardia mangyaensis]
MTEPAPAPGAVEPDPTVLDLLQGSALAPLLDLPVSGILDQLGLPPLPQIPEFPPLPDFPPLPMLDLAALMQPLTDLASAFGTGQIAPTAPAESTGDPAAAPTEAAVDPSQVLSLVSSTLESVLSLGSSALQMAMSMWQGAGADSATDKAAQTVAPTAAIGSQATAMNSINTGALVSVGTGKLQLAAIISKYLATTAATAPFLATPPGQAFLIANTVETVAEGSAVVAKTRSELAVQGASVTTAGEKVPVPGAPTGMDVADQLSQLLGLLQPLMGLATTGVQTATKLAEHHATLTAATEAETDRADSPGAVAAGGGFAGGGVGGAGAAVGRAAAALNPWPGTRAAGVVGPSTSGFAAPGTPGEHATGAAGRGMGMGGGMMPMGAGAGAAAGRAGESIDDATRTHLVTDYGDEVVGDIDAVATPVVGAAAAEPNAAPPPDKELTL